MPEEQFQSQQAVEEMERPVEKQDGLDNTGSQPENSGEVGDVENATPELQKKVRRPAKKPSSPPPDVRSYKSYWPFALAILLSISLMGVVTYPILFFIGMVLCVVVVIAWGVERK